MRVLFVAFLVLLSALDCCGAEERKSSAPSRRLRQIDANPYEVLFNNSLRLSTVGRMEAGHATLAAEDKKVLWALNNFFPQTANVFTSKLYFASFFRKRFARDTTISHNIKENRKKHRAAFQQNYEADDRYQQGIFKLLVALDKAQDDDNKKEVSRIIFALFEHNQSTLDPVKELYLSMLKGQELVKFIQVTDDRFLGRESNLFNDLLRRSDLRIFNKVCDKLNGRMFEIRAKNTTFRALCFSGFYSFAYAAGGCLGFAFNNSISSIKGSKVIKTDESIVEIDDNDTFVENTTRTSEEILVGYESIARSFPLIGASLISFGFSLCWGQKFIHDLSLRFNKDIWNYELQWLALYTAGHSDMFDDSITARLEEAVEGQQVFFGKGRSKFVKKIIAEMDAYANQLRRRR